MKDEFRNVPPDILPVITGIVSLLNKLTVLDQEDVLEILMVRHIMRRAYPDGNKVREIMLDVIMSIGEVTQKAMEEHYERQN